MIKNDIILALEKKTNLSHSKASAFVEALIKALKQALVEEGEIEIRGFGSFRVVNKKKGFGRDIRRQRQVAIEAGKRVKFLCGQDLKSLGSVKRT